MRKFPEDFVQVCEYCRTDPRRMILGSTVRVMLCKDHMYIPLVYEWLQRGWDRLIRWDDKC